MKNFVVVSTLYCKNCKKPTPKELKNRFNFDGDDTNIMVNFANNFDPLNTKNIPEVGISKRKDLIYGKIFQLKKFVEENVLGKYFNILHIDYNDIKFSRSCICLFDNFKQSGKDIVISTEKNCWPHLNVVSEWIGKLLPEKEFYYINSGAIISKTEIFYEILKKLELLCLNSNIDFWDDQGVWQYYNLTEGGLDTDTNSEYFFSTADLDETYYKFEDGFITTKFGTKPYLIHDNSSFSLNLIGKITHE